MKDQILALAGVQTQVVVLGRDGEELGPAQFRRQTIQEAGRRSVGRTGVGLLRLALDGVVERGHGQGDDGHRHDEHRQATYFRW